MKLAIVFGIIIATLLFTLYEWPKIDKSKKNDKWAFIILTMIGLLLSVLLIYFPNMPGPTELVDAIFKPLAKYLE